MNVAYYRQKVTETHCVNERVIYSTDLFKSLIQSGIRIKWHSIANNRSLNYSFNRLVQRVMIIQEGNTTLCLETGVSRFSAVLCMFALFGREN